MYPYLACPIFLAASQDPHTPTSLVDSSGCLIGPMYPYLACPILLAASQDPQTPTSLVDSSVCLIRPMYPYLACPILLAVSQDPHTPTSLVSFFCLSQNTSLPPLFHSSSCHKTHTPPSHSSHYSGYISSTTHPSLACPIRLAVPQGPHTPVSFIPLFWLYHKTHKHSRAVSQDLMTPTSLVPFFRLSHKTHIPLPRLSHSYGCTTRPTNTPLQSHKTS